MSATHGCAETIAISLSSPPQRHHLCVVIPAYNEELLVGRCIQSVLTAGVAPGDIYLVNDRSTDDTVACAERFVGVNVLTNPVQLGKMRGLHRAVDVFGLSTRYQFLALLDADSHVSSNYFSEVVHKFDERADTVLVCGAPSSDRYNWLTAYRALEYAISLRTYRTGQDALGVITVAPGCASTYRTHVLHQFDWECDTLVEDMDLTVQVHRKQLGRISYAPAAVTYTQDPRGLSEYIGQVRRWYCGTWQVVRQHRIPLGGQRIDVEFALLLGEGLVCAALTVLLPLIAIAWPSVVLRYVMVDQILWLALALAAAVRLRRADVLWAFPTFIVARALSAAILLQTFWLEIVCRRRQRQWFSVRRYDAVTSEAPHLESSNA